MSQDEIIEMAQGCGLVGMRPHLDGIYVESLVAFAKLVAEKALAQPEQEPVAWMDEEMTCIFFDAERPEPFDFDFWKPLYATLPQRKPLTNGEIYTAYITATNQMLRAQDERLAFAFARAIEAAHGIKEKNT